MNIDDFMKNPAKAVEDEFRKVIHEAEAPYWKNFNSKHWSNDLENDPEAQDYFIKLGER